MKAKNLHNGLVSSIAAGTLMAPDGSPVYAVSTYATAPDDGRPLHETIDTDPLDGRPTLYVSFYEAGTLMTDDGRPVHAITTSDGATYTDFAMVDDFDNSIYYQTADNTGASGTEHVAVSSLAGYTFTATGSCYELNSDGTIAGPFAANVPAITDEGYKARQALTNVFLQSQQFNHAAWTKANLTVTADATTAPDGTTTADLLTSNAATATTRVYQNVGATTAGQTITSSHIVKANGVRWVYISGASGGGAVVWFDLVNGVVGTQTVGTGYIQQLANGFYRITFIYTTTADAASTNVFLTAANANGSTGSYVGDGIKGFYAWQADAFIGQNLPDGGPIIVTTTAAATRGEALLSHNLFADGSALTDQDMLIWVKGTVDEIASIQTLFDISDGTADNRLLAYLPTSSNPVLRVAAGGTFTNTTFSGGPVSAGAEMTYGFRRLSSVWTPFIYDGATLTTGTNAAGFPAGMTKGVIGNSGIASQPFRGTIDSAFIDYGTFSDDAAVIAAITGAP